VRAFSTSRIANFYLS